MFHGFEVGIDAGDFGAGHDERVDGGLGKVVEAVPVGVGVEDSIGDEAVEFFFE